jgi:DNA-binding beta-propeller fold protein YncE
MHLCQEQHSVDIHCHVASLADPALSSSRAALAGNNGNEGRRDRNNQRCWLVFSLLIILLIFPGAIFALDGAPHIVKYQPVLSISGSMKLPSDVEVDQSGRIFILDGTADIVRVYSSKGEPIFTLGGAEILKQPLGIDVSPGGDVVVADSGNHRLAFFPAENKTPHYIDVPSSVDGKPSDPTDVNFGPDNTFIVVDNDNHRVVSLTRSGKVLWATGTMGRNPGEFRFPFLMDIDSLGRIYIVEAINTRVQVLESNGKFARFIGEWGIEPGQFFRPKGVVVNDKNEVFVSDSYLGVIQVFKREGGLIGVIGDGSGKITKFKTPVGMAISGNRLFVVEMFNNRVLILEKQDQ